jgi:hypothetical protein
MIPEAQAELAEEVVHMAEIPYIAEESNYKKHKNYKKQKKLHPQQKQKQEQKFFYQKNHSRGPNSISRIYWR